jgi:hypothetical protein
LGGETHRGSGEEGNNKENRPDCRGSAETRRGHEAAVGHETNGRSGKEKSGLSCPRSFFEAAGEAQAPDAP